MAITNAKHIVAELNGIRCTIVETGASLERAAFIKDLLESNKLEVQEMKETKKEPSDPDSYTIGVTDIVFNPVFAIYERRLKTREGKLVTPAYWRQECDDCDPRYWIRRKGSSKHA